MTGFRESALSHVIKSNRVLKSTPLDPFCPYKKRDDINEIIDRNVYLQTMDTVRLTSSVPSRENNSNIRMSSKF